MNAKVLTTLGLLSIAAASLPALADTEHLGEHVTFITPSGYSNGGCMTFQTEEGGGQLGIDVYTATYYGIGLGPSSPYFSTAALEIMAVSTSRYSLGTQTINFTSFGPGTGSQYYSDCKTSHTAVARIGQ